MNFDTKKTHYRKELEQNVIPFWENQCIDEKYGGYFTFLDRDGTVYDTDKYMWMQWRIVYQFATLAVHPLYSDNLLYRGKKDSWLKIAEDGYDFLVKNGKDESGNYYFALNRKGRPITAPYNIYSEAFAVLGSAALYNATKNAKYKKSALESMENYISRLKNPKGKWEKSLSARRKRHTLGNYMIMANLGLTLEETLEVNKYRNKIDEANKMVLEKFWNSDHRVIFENINQDFTFDLESCDGRHIIPGHGLEACWFLLEYASKMKNKQNIEKICEMIKGQIDFGWDKKYGGIFYFMDMLGRPHVELQWDMKLWWVHNEALIATLVGYQLTGDKELLQWFQKVEDWTWQRFPDAEYGEWFGYLNRQGNPTHSLKGGKWKTFFHLPRYLLKSIEMFEQLGDS